MQENLSIKILQNHFPRYFQDSGIFFQVTFKIQEFSYKLLLRFRHLLPRYFKHQTFSSKIFQDSDFSCKILQDQTFSSKIFQLFCKNNALLSEILEVKTDYCRKCGSENRLLQKMYGSSTGEFNYFKDRLRIDPISAC